MLRKALAVLEKNVNELQKLLEMKNQKLAELAATRQEAGSPSRWSAEAGRTAKTGRATETCRGCEAGSPRSKRRRSQSSRPSQSRSRSLPKWPSRQSETAGSETGRAAETCSEPPKVVVPPPPAGQQEPGLSTPCWKTRCRWLAGRHTGLAGRIFCAQASALAERFAETTAPPVPSSLGPNSVFRMTGGQSVDTGNTPPQTGDFSQTGPGTIDTDEVDPVAEADVYMAYGRDTQAEEILLEALQKDPHRTAIHAKLLEIYANRRSHEAVRDAGQRVVCTDCGVGPDWEKVALLGLALDPNNPLYSGASAKAAPAVVVAEPEVVPVIPEPEPVPEPVPEPEPMPIVDVSDEFDRSTMVMPKETEAQPEVVAEAASDAMALDFDLGAETVAPGMMPGESMAEEPAAEGDVASDTDALDFDLGSEFSAPESVADVVDESKSRRAVQLILI
jgi:pilus assembly protein FimV